MSVVQLTNADRTLLGFGSIIKFVIAVGAVPGSGCPPVLVVLPDDPPVAPAVPPPVPPDATPPLPGGVPPMPATPPEPPVPPTEPAAPPVPPLLAPGSPPMAPPPASSLHAHWTLAANPTISNPRPQTRAFIFTGSVGGDRQRAANRRSVKCSERLDAALFARDFRRRCRV